MVVLLSSKTKKYFVLFSTRGVRTKVVFVADTATTDRHGTWHTPQSEKRETFPRIMFYPHHIKNRNLRDLLKDDDPASAPTSSPRRTHQNETAGSSSSSSSSDSSSLLSQLSDRSESDDDALRETKTVIILATLEQKWDNLERKFAQRARLLERIGKGKSKDFIRQLRDREQKVRRQTLEQLLQTEARDAKERAIFQRRLDVESFSKGHVDDDDARRQQSFRQRCYDCWVFERNSSMPAIFSLVVHCWAHIGIFDGLGSVADAFKTKIAHVWALESTHSLDVTIFLFGVFLMRLSGDLFWWLSDEAYDRVKFDLHNRLRLQCWDAYILSVVRERDILRVILFMVGFTFTYISTIALLSYLKQPFDQREELLRDMPSLKWESPKQTIVESFCSNICQVEMKRQGK